MTPSSKKQLGLISLTNVPARAVHLGTIPDPRASADSIVITEVLAIDHLLVQRSEGLLLPSRQPKWSNQFEMPLEGVAWMVETIEEKFERSPADGGLPKGKFSASAVIGGEHLQLRHGVSIGGEGIPGYVVNNFDRQDYITTYMEEAQEFDFTLDQWNDTLRAFYKQIAERVAAGEFGKPRG
jgi:hypothetical protein